MSTIGWLYDEHGTQGKAWNPVTGCTPVSPGCLNCYAASLASRGMCEAHRGITRITKRRNDQGRHVGRPVFNGTVHLHDDRINQPRRWKKGRRVFVNSMSDLFHEDVPFQLIAAVYKTMAECPQHTFLVLTKRPDRAREWYAWAASRIGYFTEGGTSWPLRNVQLGVSAENRKTFIERVPVLLQCDAAIRWVSIEPILGPMPELLPWLPHAFNREPHCEWCEDCVTDGPRERWTESRPERHGPFLDWVVVGGESGPGARPADLAWFDWIAVACRLRGVPLFVKQLGANPTRNGKRIVLQDKKGEDPDEWRERHLVVRQLPPPPIQDQQQCSDP